MFEHELDMVVIVCDELFDMHQLAADAPLRHLKEQLLGLVDHLIDLALIFISQRGDLPCGRDEPTQGALPLDDARIVLNVHRGWHGIDQR